MKEKNKKILGGNKAQTLNVVLPDNLQLVVKESLVKQTKVTVAKKVDNSVQQVTVNFKVEDLSNANAPRYQKPNNQNNNAKKPQKAKINFDDLPSLI